MLIRADYFSLLYLFLRDFKLFNDRLEQRLREHLMACVHIASEVLPGVKAVVFSFFCCFFCFRNGKRRQERLKRSMKKQRRSTKRVAGCPPPLPRSKTGIPDQVLFILNFNQTLLSLHDRLIRETKKSTGKKEEKKRKSAGGDKDKERGGGNDSFKSREFIETSEESSSDSDRKSKSKKKKKKEVTGRACCSLGKI